MEEKMIRLTLKTESRKGNTTTTIEEDAIIRINGSTVLKQFLQFEKEAKAIFRKSVKALKTDPFRTSVTLAITHWDGEHAENLVHSNWFTSRGFGDNTDNSITLYAHSHNDIMVEDKINLNSDVIGSIAVVDYQ